MSGAPLVDAGPELIEREQECAVLDSLVDVEDARGFVEQLRATSSNPVVYAELPGAQHGFDLIRSRRFDTVIDAIEAFASQIRSRHRAADRIPGAVSGS